jgi:hypothetical protein
MNKLSTIFATGMLTCTLSATALTVGVPSSYATTQYDPGTIAELEEASRTAQREAYEGNKDNPTFGQKSYQIDQLVARMKNGQPVDQKQIDEALQPVVVW